MTSFELKTLGEKIKEIFLTQEKYKLAKHIQEFLEGDKFLGDYWMFYMFEPHGELPPTIYSVLSPYDMVSKKDPEQAVVFEDGNVILNVDFTHYVEMRTGIMDSLVLQHLDITSLKGKKILYFGTGKVAKVSLKALKEYYSDVERVDYINKSGKSDEFEKLGGELGIKVGIGSKENLSEYDYIFCHTASGAGNVLTDEDLNKIKQGAVITTFVSINGDAELPKSFYDSNKINLIIDWEESIDGTKELKEAIQEGKVKKETVYTLKDLFSNNMYIDPEKQYTIYRSTGTPMQNLAVLKLLLASE